MTNVSIRYKHYDLGAQPAGTIVEVALSCINNVRLMDAANVAQYKENKVYRFNGGLVQKTPTRLTVPRHGHWHVVVDKEGLNALANSKVRIMRPAGMEEWTMPAAAESAPATPEPASEPAPGLSNAASQPLDMPISALNVSTDGLTGLPNRDAFEERLARLFAAGADMSAYAIVILNIDDLKEFNDKFGRAAGDAALEAIAALMKKSVNGNDFVARTGGLEFAVVTKCGTEDIAKMIAERLANAIGTFEQKNESGESLGTLQVSSGACMGSAATDAQSFFEKAQASVSSKSATVSLAYSSAAG